MGGEGEGLIYIMEISRRAHDLDEPRYGGNPKH